MEFLVRAESHPMDKLTQEEVDKLNSGQRDSYNARLQKGDIVVVRPDGWKWGKCECLPEFIVVKVPGVPVNTDYDRPLISAPIFVAPLDGSLHSKVLKVRKQAVPKVIMDELSLSSVSVVEKTKADFIDSLTEKVG